MSTIDIPGYKIVKTLGVGGQATVYLAIQKGFDRKVALKVMSPALAADPTFGERFVREAKIVAKLSHKSIVTVYDVGESGSFYYLAMEYLPGGDLKSRIADGMKAREALSIISKLAKALHFAHDKGYVHRDVKSENILFDSDGEPLLTDFGIAKASNSSTQMTQTGKLIGTPEYMSPEQCRGKPVDARSDLYSLGVIFYEILTKGVPFTGEDSVAVCIKHVTKPIPQLPARLKHFQWLIDLLLAKEPDKRFQTGTELSIAIDEFKNSGKQSDIKGESTTKAKPKTKVKAANKARSFVATDEEIESFDDLHSEARAFVQEEPKSNVKGIVISSLLVLTVAAGFITQERWLPQVKSVIAGFNNPQSAPTETNEKDKKQAVDESVLSNGVNRKQSQTENKNAGQTNSKTVTNVDSLLADAEKLSQLKPLNLNNIKQALQLIGTVKTIDKDNQIAHSTYQNIINLSLTEAATLGESGAFEQADVWLKLVELESPNHTLLDATRQKVEALQSQSNLKRDEQAETALKIQRFLNQAELALSENRLSAPPNDNAIALYQSVLSLEPDNQVAKDGLTKVAAAYENLIEKAIQDKSFARARSMLTRFNSLSEDENLKLALKDKIAKSEQSYKAAEAEKKRLAAIETARKKAEAERAAKLSDPLVQMKLSSSLDSAKALEEQLILVEPPENNALEKYRNVLEIDDRNQEAKDGIERIEATILANLTERIANNKRQEAIVWLNKLEIFNPAHKEYASFNDAILNIVEPTDESVQQEINEQQENKQEEGEKEGSETDGSEQEKNDVNEEEKNEPPPEPPLVR